MKLVGTSLLLGILLSGCSSNPSQHVDRFAAELGKDSDEYHANVIAFTQVGERTRVDSAVRTKGAVVAGPGLALLTTVSAPWGQIELLAPTSTSDAVSKRLDLGSDNESRWAGALVSTLTNSMDVADIQSVGSVLLKIIALPEGVLFEHNESSYVGAQPTVITSLVAIDLDSSHPAPHWYSEIAKNAAHEILHLSLAVNGKKPPNEINEETAAYLFGWCGVVNYARHVNADLGVSATIVDEDHYIADKRKLTLAPDMIFLNGKPATGVGASLATAVLIVEIGRTFTTSDTKLESLLLPACAAFPGGDIPDFIAGQALSK